MGRIQPELNYFESLDSIVSRNPRYFKQSDGIYGAFLHTSIITIKEGEVHNETKILSPIFVPNVWRYLILFRKD